MKILPLNMQAVHHADVQIMNIYLLMILRFAAMSPIRAIAYRKNWSKFCPFCANKPENAQHFVKQTNLNVSRSEEVGTSDSTQLKNKIDVCQVNITNSESTVIQGAYGDSYAESESTESDCSNENNELYSASDATVDNYDDSNEITVENTSGKNRNYKVILRNILRLWTNSDILDKDDDDYDNDDKLDCDESDETDSEQKIHQSMFRDNQRRRRGMKYNRGKARFMTKTKSNSGKTVTK
uniref:Uncharacterized protein n=1 Tax=Wuchereria bancrofti TaxID=6293 RepID=A0AAF5Q6P9_WUCBA